MLQEVDSVQLSDSGAVLLQYRDNVVELNEYPQLDTNKLLNRLHGFLLTRIPLNRSNILPGQHWVWDSLR